jgi:putative phosphoribosyl transferase
MNQREVRIRSFGARLHGELSVPEGASGLILIVEGEDGSRRSAAHHAIAAALGKGGRATLLMDLLTDEEAERDRYTHEFRFDVDLLTRRLLSGLMWAREEEATRALRLGILGAGTAAAAALRAAALQPDDVGALVSLRGRPEFTVGVFGLVKAPTLLIVGEHDPSAELHRAAIGLMVADKKLVTLPAAQRGDEGAAEEIARLAGGWFAQHLG